MNSQNAKEYLPFVQALAEGKTIQNRPPGCARWIDGNEWLFDNTPPCYRIKPEPRRRWLFVIPSTGFVSNQAWSSENALHNWCSVNVTAKYEAVEFVEVLK